MERTSNINNKNNAKDFANKLWSLSLSLAGFLFVLNYIFKASMDVPTSDYIRIINSYIDNVFDIKKFLVPDLVARVPITYLFRIINVTFFKYSIHFDRVVGLIFLSIFNFLIVKRVREKITNDLLKNLTSIVLTINIFSLMSWEMLLNGSGYTIFLFFDLVLIIYDIYENLNRGDVNRGDGGKQGDGGFIKSTQIEHNKNNVVLENEKKTDSKVNMILYILLILATCFFTGSDYQVALICTIIFFSLIIFVINLNQNRGDGGKQGDGGFIKSTQIEHNKNNIAKHCGIINRVIFIIHNKQFVIILTSVLAFLIYYIGNHAGEVANYTYVGMSNRSIFDIIIHDFPYCLSYVIKSLASIIIGVETFEYALTLGNIKEIHILLVGIVFLLIILLVIFLIFYYKVYKKDLFAVMIFFHGLLSILFVFISRAPFLNDHYGMSSRYAIQFMLVPVGIILVLADIMEIKGTEDLIFENRNENKMDGDFVKSTQIEYNKNNILKYIIMFSFIAFFITYGRTITTLDEINKIPARHFCYESAYNLAHNIENYPPSEENDEFLMSIFEYRRGADLIRDAFGTLKKHKLNVYR